MNWCRRQGQARRALCASSARLLSAFLIPASEVGPLMPGVTVLRLSPVLCWLPSGSRDQNTRTNGLLRALNIGSTTLAATSANRPAGPVFGTIGAGRLASPALLFRRAAASPVVAGFGKGGFHLLGKRYAVFAAGGIIEHDRMIAFEQAEDLVGWSKIRVGPTLPSAAVLKSLEARHLQDGLFVQIVAAKMLIDICDDAIYFQERGHRSARRPDRISSRCRWSSRICASCRRGHHHRAIAEALAVVKVGNIECEFLKLTPRSRTSAMAGAVSALTIRPRKPSGTNRMTLWGRLGTEEEAALAGRGQPNQSNRQQHHRAAHFTNCP